MKDLGCINTVSDVVNYLNSKIEIKTADSLKRSAVFISYLVKNGILINKKHRKERAYDKNKSHYC